MKTVFEILNELYDQSQLHSIGEIFNSVYESGAANGDILKFPFAGSLKSPYGAIPEVTNGRYPITYTNVGIDTPGAELTLFTAEGSGVVRHIHLAGAGAGWLAATLDIYYGAEETPSFSVPLSDLFALTNQSGTGEGQHWITKYISVVANLLDGDNQAGLMLDLPIPYTDGITIKFNDGGSTMPIIYSSVRYQDTLPACWNRNYKLKATRTTGTLAALADGTGTISSVGTAVTGVGTAFTTEFAVGDSIIVSSALIEITAIADNTHMTIEFAPSSDWPALTAFKIGKNRQFADITGNGVVIASMAAFNPGDNTDYYLESNPHFHIDGDITRTVEWAGAEDYFGGAYYWAGGYLQGDNYGLGWHDTTNKAHTAYRFHAQDPVFFTTGCKGHFPNDFFNGVNAAPAVDTTWVCLYYLED
jgi:hypothetical protein